MNQTFKPEVVFLRVTDNNTKLRRIVSTIHQHFFAGDKVIILVPNQQAEDFIDQLLWRMPDDAFVPHVISEESSDERIVVTQQISNLNDAKIAINLTTTPCEIVENIEFIYELMDETDPQKSAQSCEKVAYWSKEN